MKIIWFIAFVLFYSNFGICQDPYELDIKKDGIILGATSGLVCAGIFMNAEFEPLTPIMIADLDKDIINDYDRFATENYSDAANQRSDISLITSAVLSLSSIPAFTFYSSEEFSSRTGKLGYMWLETNLVNYAGTGLVKTLTKRTRPYVYNPAIDLNEKLKLDARKSFFSGHTSVSAANSFFFAKVFSDYYPESKWKPMVWSIAAIVPAWTGLERVLAGEHFPSDVITGYFFGALCGYFIPHLHLKEKKPADFISLYPLIGKNFTGLGLMMNW